MPERTWEDVDLESLATRVGTPFYVFSAAVLRRRIADVSAMMAGAQLQARYAMKACSTRRVLEEIRAGGLWIDAVSGNEVLRAERAGFSGAADCPVILLTADVFRDNALAVVLEGRALPNIGSPAMVETLATAGYSGPIGVRLNPGFGHGHVRECDTGGPSSKHGIWYEELEATVAAARAAGLPVTLLHAHIGSGPSIDEFTANMAKLGVFFRDRLASFPDVAAVNFGGGIPHPYRPEQPAIDLAPVGAALREAQAALSETAGRPIRVEIEPGRYLVAPAAALVARVHDIKRTCENDKGPGHTFAMVDAGFNDLVRPAMYGSYHHITVHGASARPTEPVVIAGPLCESGDVFTRDAREFLEPRAVPALRRGDLVVFHDAGAYGASMSSHYNSLGRVPQVWLDGDAAFMMTRRETLDDIIGAECLDPV